MANDDEVLGESSYEPADHQPGARRSTFTPPTESTAVPGPGDLSHEPNHEPPDPAAMNLLTMTTSSHPRSPPSWVEWPQGPLPLCGRT